MKVLRSDRKEFQCNLSGGVDYYCSTHLGLLLPNITENTEVVEITLTPIDNIDDAEGVPENVPDTYQYEGCEKEPTWEVSEMYSKEATEKFNQATVDLLKALY